MPVREDVDIDRLEDFRAFLGDNPEKVRLQLEARAVYEGQAGRSTVHIGPYGLDGDRIERQTRHYTVPFGAWREVEEQIGMVGPTDRMEPVEMALAATAACLINSISWNTARMGIDTEDMEITIRTTVDPRVLFAVKGPEDHGSCLGSIEYEVTVGGDVTEDQLATIKELCRYSPVHGMMTEPITVSGRVSRG